MWLNSVFSFRRCASLWQIVKKFSWILVFRRKLSYVVGTLKKDTSCLSKCSKLLLYWFQCVPATESGSGWAHQERVQGYHTGDRWRRKWRRYDPSGARRHRYFWSRRLASMPRVRLRHCAGACLTRIMVKIRLFTMFEKYYCIAVQIPESPSVRAWRLELLATHQSHPLLLLQKRHAICDIVLVYVLQRLQRANPLRPLDTGSLQCCK